LVRYKQEGQMRADSEFPPTAFAVGLTDRAPKTAALMFDRVITLGEPCPEPIGLDVFAHDRSGDGRKVGLEFVIDGENTSILTRDEAAKQPPNLYSGDNLDAAWDSASNFLLRIASEELRLKLGLEVYPMYHSIEAYSSEYKPGNYSVITASLENLKPVQEGTMDWPQVIEFRSDKDAHRKYRRMIHWLDGNMLGRSQEFVEDEIAAEIEDYERALRKHGLDTCLGILKDILDPKVLVAATAVGGALFQVDSLLGVLAGSGITLANVVVKAVKDARDLKSANEASRGHIAYILQLHDRFG
jgi:hypothetical protein